MTSSSDRSTKDAWNSFVRYRPFDLGARSVRVNRLGFELAEMLKSRHLLYTSIVEPSVRFPGWICGLWIQQVPRERTARIPQWAALSSNPPQPQRFTSSRQSRRMFGCSPAKILLPGRSESSLKSEIFICSNFHWLKATDESTNSRNWPPCTPFGSGNTTESLRCWISSTRSGTTNASTKKLGGLWLLKSSTSLTRNLSRFC
jgi:hypothetical protein